MKDREQATQQPQNLRIVEDIDHAQMIEAVMHNYSNAQTAFMELIDNAVDNRIEGKQSLVTVRARNNELFVANMGGKGLDLNGLHNFFVWGFSEKRGEANNIGRYGIGGKAAMGYLGNAIKIWCSAQGSDTAYSVEDKNFTTRESGRKKELEAKPSEALAEGDGYFNITISNLKRKGAINEQTLTRRLGEIYRPLLMSQNGKEPAIHITVNGKDVEPLEIPYILDDPALSPQTYRIVDLLDHDVNVTLGVLEEESESIDPGVRCYVDGRLISKGEFFGVSRSIAGSNRLTGEAHLDHVPVTTNKTAFDEDSKEWRVASRAIGKILREHWVEKLKSLKVDRKHEPSKEEIGLARQLKADFECFLSATNFLTRYDLNGVSSGRLPTVNPGETRPTPTGTHKSPEGKTPPANGATEGKGRVKRWGPFADWGPKALGNTKQRSAVLEESGREVLRINTDYLAYQKAKTAGLSALDTYMVDTVSLEIGRRVKGDSVEEYYEFVTEMLREFTEFREAEKNKIRGEVIFSRQKRR